MSAQTHSVPTFRAGSIRAGVETYLPNLTARARQVLPGDYLLNAADEPVVQVTKVEILHGTHTRVRISGVTTPRTGGKKRGYVRTVGASQAARIARPVTV